MPALCLRFESEFTSTKKQTTEGCRDEIKKAVMESETNEDVVVVTEGLTLCPGD